jgi:2-keto-3-deoxy-L-rhamnonate aldolase RhmA
MPILRAQPMRRDHLISDRRRSRLRPRNRPHGSAEHFERADELIVAIIVVEAAAALDDAADMIRAVVDGQTGVFIGSSLAISQLATFDLR